MRQMPTGMPSGDSWKIFSPKCIMILSIVLVHVSKLSDMQVTEIVLVILEPGDVACPIRCRNSTA